MGSPSDKSSHREEAAAFQANPQSSDPWNFGAGRAKNIQAGQEMVSFEFHLWSGLEKKAKSSFRVVIFKIEDVGCLHFCVGFCLQKGSILSG